MNLIDDLGLEYVNENLAGALLFKDGLAHQIRDVTPKRIRTLRYSGSMKEPKMEEIVLSTSFFDSGFSSLAYPELGYRTSADGKILIDLRHQQSFRRGLQINEIIVRYPPVTEFIADRFDIRMDYYHQHEVVAMAVTENNFVSLAEGLRRVKDKEAYLFAVNKHLAVMPSGVEGEYLEIVYRGRTVGSIDENHKITGRITNVKAIMEKLNGQ